MVLVTQLCVMFIIISTMVMTVNKLLRLSIILLIIVLIPACSVFTKKEAFLPTPKSNNWTEITEENELYKFTYTCHEDSLRIREIPIRGGFGLFGIPVIPFIPIFMSEGHANLYIDIHYSSNKELLPEPIDIELNLPNQEKTFLPIDIFPVQLDFDVLEREGFYYTNFIVAEENRIGRTYLYKFDLDKKDINTFEITFLSDYKGCLIPKLTYNRQSVFRYEPLTIPLE